MQLFIPYRYLAPVLKWLTLSLFAYVAVLLTVDIPWTELVVATLIPPLELTREYLMLLVAVLGTTISPYLFFWQASQEVEEQRATDGRRAAARLVAGARAIICGGSRSTRGSAWRSPTRSRSRSC